MLEATARLGAPAAHAGLVPCGGGSGAVEARDRSVPVHATGDISFADFQRHIAALWPAAARRRESGLESGPRRA